MLQHIFVDFYMSINLPYKKKSNAIFIIIYIGPGNLMITDVLRQMFLSRLPGFILLSCS